MGMRMNPYLTTNGNGKEVIEFYKKALGAEVLNAMTFGEMPPDPNHPLPAEAKDRIMHAHLKVGETDLMISDTFIGQEAKSGDQVTIALMVPDYDQSKRIFDALAEGGKVSMEFQQTFWSPGYGMVTDKFGVGWQISTEAKQ